MRCLSFLFFFFFFFGGVGGGGASVAHSLKPSDFAVLGDVAVSVAGSNTTPIIK